MQVTNLTNETVGIAGVSIPKRQTRNVKGWDRVKDSRRVRELLDSGAISIPVSEPVSEPEPEQPKRGFFGSLRDDSEDDQ